MKKRSRILYAFSFLLPFAAIAILCMRSFNEFTRPVAMTVYFVGWVMLFLSIRSHRRSHVVTRRKGRRLKAWLRENKRFLMHGAGLALFAYLAWIVFPMDSLEFADMDRDDLVEMLEAHRIQAITCAEGQHDVLARLTERPDLFKRPTSELTTDERRWLQEHWGMYIAYTMELERIMHTHKHWLQLMRYPDLQRLSFFLAYATFTRNYVHALELTQLVNENQGLEVLFNEANDDLQIPAKAYYHVKHSITDPDNLLRLNVGRSMLLVFKEDLIDDGWEAEVSQVELEYRSLLKLVDYSSEVLVENSAEKLEDLSFEVWLPIQKGVAEGMSYVRFTKRDNLVDRESIKSIETMLQPGDILIERRNWYLTNVGIPGFWPHAALYTGSLEEMDQYFSTVSMPSKKPVSVTIKETMPDVFQAYQKVDVQGDIPRVIESIRPGVCLTALEKSANADYLAVLRPRLDKQDKLGALLKAFSYYGRPYDYNFNFVTDNELVCSELVYKAYTADKDREGLSFNLITMSGRKMIPPNLMVKKFDEEYGRQDAELEFVLFLDGSEDEGCANLKDVHAFRESWKRPKWSASQE